MDSMERISLRMPGRMVDDLDKLIDDGYYHSRSEAIREAVRDLFDKHEGRPREGRR